VDKRVHFIGIETPLADIREHAIFQENSASGQRTIETTARITYEDNSFTKAIYIQCE
jgi:hypothetical protein